MKTFIPVLVLLPLFSLSQIQRDTLFKKDGLKIICQVTKIDNDYIFFNTDKLKRRYIAKENVLSYSINGRREASVLTPSPNEVASYRVSLNDTVSVSQELDYMKWCLRACHKEYTIGLIVLGGGSLINTVVLANYQGPDVSRPLLIVGSAAILAGVIVLIDSHKWLKKAGLGVNGNGGQMNVYYRFK